MQVLEDEDDGSRQVAAEPGARLLLEHALAEARVERSDRLGHREVDTGDRADQRDPPGQIGAPLRVAQQLGRHNVRRRLGRQVEGVAHHPAPRGVRRGRGVGLPRHTQHLERRAQQQLLDQPALAHPPLGAEPQHPTHRPGRPGLGEQHAELVLAADHRRTQHRRGRAGLADRPRPHRLALALGLEGGQLGGVVLGAAAVEHRAQRADLPRIGRRHQPRGEVHAVAAHRVHPAIGRSVVAREDPPVVHAGAQRERAVVVHDLVHRREHPRLVVAGGARRAGHDDELAAVGVHIGREQRHLVGGDRGLGARQQGAQGLEDAVTALALEEAVDAGEAHEADGDAAVLGRHGAVDHVGGERGLHRTAEVHAAGLDRPHGRETVEHLDVVLQEEPGPDRAATHDARLVPQRRGGRGGHHHLTALGVLLHRRHRRGSGAHDEELAGRRVRQEQVDRPGVHADRHAEPHRSGRGAQAADRGDRALHQPGRPAGPGRVTAALEGQQDGVTAPLEQARAVLVGVGEEVVEGRVERLAHLLGAGLAAARQPLGERGEARDVGEHQRALERAGLDPRRGREPVDDQPGDVGKELRARRRRRDHPLVALGSPGGA